MEDVTFTGNWLLKQPKAVEKIMLNWPMLIERELEKMVGRFMLPEFKDIQKPIFNSLKLRPLKIHELPDRPIFIFTIPDLFMFGERDDRRLQEIVLSYSGSSGLWRQMPPVPFTPTARGRILEGQVVLSFYCSNGRLEWAYDMVCAAVERLHEVLPSHQPLIDDHNARLRDFIPTYLRKHEQRIKARLEPWKIDISIF